jgi:hypothetical protein
VNERSVSQIEARHRGRGTDPELDDCPDSGAAPDPIVYRVMNSGLEVIAIRRARGKLWSEVEPDGGREARGSEAPSRDRAEPASGSGPA